MKIDTFRKYVGMQIKIPELFIGNEELFIQQVAEQLADVPVKKFYKIMFPDGQMRLLTSYEIFTGLWEFIDTPNG